MGSIGGESEAKAARYLRRRAEQRESAEQAFISGKPGVIDLVAVADELIASLTYFVVDKDLRPIDKGLYIGDLIVSFCRSHFISSDLLMNCELIEVSVILRKQMELVSRLHELTQEGDLDDLIGRTPNVRHLRPVLRKLYGGYSAIAHSSYPLPLQLLGEMDGANGTTGTPLYPVFLENAYVALHHWAVLTMAFSIWAQKFFASSLAPYDPAHDQLLGNELIVTFTKVFELDKPATS